MRLFIFNCDGVFDSLAQDEFGTASNHPLYHLLLHLSEYHDDQVVVVSGRKPEDVAGIIDTPGIIIGGHHGLVWQLPGGAHVGPFHGHEDELVIVRSEILLELMDLAWEFKLQFEDRIWSLIIDTRNTDRKVRQQFMKRLKAMTRIYSLPCNFNRDGQLEVQMISGYNKSAGISHLVRFFGITHPKDRIFYTGDESSDQPALWWSVLSGNTAVVVKECLMVPDTLFVNSADELLPLFKRIAPPTSPRKGRNTKLFAPEPK